MWIAFPEHQRFRPHRIALDQPSRIRPRTLGLPASSVQGHSDRCPRRRGFLDVFFLCRMHSHESLNRLDYALGIANEIAIDLLRWQVLDQAGEMQYLAARLTHGGKTMALLRNPGEPRIDVALVV